MSGTLLVAVVADNLEERARQIAREEGAQGVTMVPARGIGFPEHKTFFGVTYQGFEKMMLCLLDEQVANRIAERLNLELELLQPFRGLAFCLPVTHAGGFDLAAVEKVLHSGRPAP